MELYVHMECSLQATSIAGHAILFQSAVQDWRQSSPLSTSPGRVEKRVSIKSLGLEAPAVTSPASVNPHADEPCKWKRAVISDSTEAETGDRHVAVVGSGRGQRRHLLFSAPRFTLAVLGYTTAHI